MLMAEMPPAGHNRTLRHAANKNALEQQPILPSGILASLSLSAGSLLSAIYKSVTTSRPR